MTRLEVGKCYKMAFGQKVLKFLVANEKKHGEEIYYYHCISECDWSKSLDCGIHLWNYSSSGISYNISKAVELTGDELEEFKSTLKFFKRG